MHRSPCDYAGFTLIELMVVACVLGILASVALPSFLDTIYRARLNRVLSEIEFLYKECIHYSIMNGSCTLAFSTRSQDPFVILANPKTKKVIRTHKLDKAFRVAASEFQGSNLEFSDGHVMNRGNGDFDREEYVDNLILADRIVAKGPRKVFAPHTLKVDNLDGEPIGCIVTYNLYGSHFRGDELYECPDNPNNGPIPNIEF